jgi:hypothetical protein
MKVCYKDVCVYIGVATLIGLAVWALNGISRA